MAGPGEIAVLIPCYNEVDTVARVVAEFRHALPGARIVVCDNASDDGTAAAARGAGAELCHEAWRGKGHAVRRLFADIEADIYVLVDGDATYDAACAPAMVALLNDGGLDMVVARRRPTADEAWRRGHRFGNRVLSAAVRGLFGPAVGDLLSGYRVLSRRFVKSFPGEAGEFEIEAELTVHALQLRLPTGELATPYRPRPRGSRSKLNTWRDGFLVSFAVAQLFALERPFRFFSVLALAFFALATVLFAPVFETWLQTGLVPRLPTLVVAVGCYVLALVCLVFGAVLHAVSTARREAKRLAYLAQSPRPGA